MRIFSYLLVVVFCLGFLSATSQQQPPGKAIAVVVDNSGSMFGRKLENAAYAVKVINSIKSKNDIVKVYANAEEVELSGSTLNQQNRELDSISSERGWSECREVSAAFPFLEQKRQEGYEPWLIILSDGELRLESSTQNFDCGRQFENKVAQFFDRTAPNIHFAEIIDGHHGDPCSLCDILQEIPLAKTKTVDVQEDPNALFEFLQRVTVNLAKGSYRKSFPYTLNDNQATFNTEFPLKKVILLYQARGKNTKMPELKNGSTNTVGELTKLSESLASNEGFDCRKGKDFDHMVQTGKVIHLGKENRDVIPRQTEFTLTFNNSLEKDRLRIVPVVALELSAYPDSGEVLLQEEGKYTICDTVSSVRVYAELEDTTGQVFKREILNNCQVTIETDNGEYELQPKNGRFSTEIPLQQTETYFSVSAEYEGYFYLKSKLFSIRKEKESCLPPCRIDLSDFPDKLNEQDTICSKVFSLNCEGVVQPSKYNAKVLNQPENYQIDVKPQGNGKYRVCAYYTGCRCFAEEANSSLKVRFIHSNLGGRKAVVKEDVRLEVINSFWDRCLSVIIWSLIGLLFLIYIFGLLVKKRFPKNGYIVRKEGDPDLDNEEDNRFNDILLSDSFFKRHCIPFFAERKRVDGFRFIADGKKRLRIWLDRHSVPVGEAVDIPGHDNSEKRPRRNLPIRIRDKIIDRRRDSIEDHVTYTFTKN